jgi:hypothetical protein
LSSEVHEFSVADLECHASGFSGSELSLAVLVMEVQAWSELEGKKYTEIVIIHGFSKKESLSKSYLSGTFKQDVSNLRASSKVSLNQ